jgi:glycosyltransferase involved in cell wall biosynthesis
MNRICMYTPSACGGHALYTRELLSALAAAGAGRCAFELVTSEDVEAQYRATGAYAVHPILPALHERSQFSNCASWAFNRVTHYVRRERRLLQWLETRPDVTAVHFQEWAPWLASPVFRRIRAMGKKVFYTVHNVVPHRYPAHVPKPLMHRWIRNACRLTDGLFVHSDLLAGELTRFLGRPGAIPPIHVVPHGVWHVSDADDLPPLQARLGERKLLFFGTIRRNKGLDLLLRAALRLPGYSITIAGYPLERPYFQHEVLPLVERARAAGVKVDLIDRFVSEAEVGQLFRSHGALVLPYTPAFAAQSGVVFMALAYGLPVIASEVGGLRDLLGRYRIGTTFGQFTPAALADAVQALHAGGSATELLEQMRAAKAHHSWEGAAQATLAGYESAAGDTTPESTEANDHRVATIPAC